MDKSDEKTVEEAARWEAHGEGDQRGAHFTGLLPSVHSLLDPIHRLVPWRLEPNSALMPGTVPDRSTYALLDCINKCVFGILAIVLSHNMVVLYS